MTQQKIILNLLRSQPDRAFKSYELQKVNTDWGWLGSESRKRGFELVADGLVKQGKEGKYATYQAIPPLKTTLYKVNGMVVGKEEKY